MLYLTIGTALFAAALVFSANQFVLPLLMATPLALVQVAHDWTARRRVLLAELAGASAISSLAAAIALAGGWSARASFVLWAIMTARVLPAIFHVRTCLKRRHGLTAGPGPMMVSHLLALLGVLGCAMAGILSSWVALAMVLLFMRTAIGFAISRRVTAKQLGFSEIVFGAMTIVIVAGSYYF